MIVNGDPKVPFEQAYYPGGPLTIAFESAQVTYSDLAVDLHNSGINQILSVAAVRGHRLFHFSMADLREHAGEYGAEMVRLELDPAWDRDDPYHAHRRLRVVDRCHVPLGDVQLFIVRGDDIRTEHTANIEILQWAATHAKVLEGVEATLSTTDKYAPVVRAPQLPHPVTFTAATLAEALAAIGRLPAGESSFVLKDRYGYGGAQVHRLAFDAPDLEAELTGYLRDYGHVLIQEFRAEVGAGDLVVTFFDDELIGARRRLLRNYGIVLGEIVMDRLEGELLGAGVETVAAPLALTWEAPKPPRFSDRYSLAGAGGALSARRSGA